MDRMLYVAMTGARQTMQSQAMTANNLANISTHGFRADLAAMRSMPLFGDGLPSRVFSMTERAGIDFNHGTMETTDRQLDVAIQGQGFFVVQSRDGSQAYTRAGDFNVSPGGILQTGNGLPVMGENGPISIPESKNILFGTDGTISIRPNDANANEITQVDRLRLVNPPLNNLQKGSDGLLRMKNGNNAIGDPNIKVVPGTLETSNVNAASELVNMIEHARQFEMQTKMMKIAEENEQRAAQIMQLG